MLAPVYHLATARWMPGKPAKCSLRSQSNLVPRALFPGFGGGPPHRLLKFRVRMFVKSAVNEAEYVMKYNKDLGGGYSPKLNGVTYGYA